MKLRCVRAGTFAGLVVCAGIALAGCGQIATSVRLPHKTAPTHPAVASKPRPPSQRQRVLAAFTGYHTALRKAANSRSAAEVRLLMHPYINSPTIANLITFDRSLWSKHEIFFGQVVYHVLAVTIDGDHAFVHDCDNTSGSGLENDMTGKLIPGSLGVKDQNIITRLNRVHGQWLIGLQTIEDVPCKP
jgi:hypothetical protein